MALKPEVFQMVMSLKTTQEVEEMFALLKSRHTQLRSAKAAEAIASGAITPGMTVTFTARHGRVVVGRVEKLNRTTASVVETTPGGFPGKWRVSISALHAA